MPNISERRHFIRQIDQELYARACAELLDHTTDESSSGSDMSVSEDSTDDDEELLSVREAVAKSRYLNARALVPKCKEFTSVLLSEYDEGRFRQEVRMSQNSFYEISQLIRDNEAFYGKSLHKQVCPELQFLVACYRFGNDGNGASLGGVARRFGISEGATVNYTERVISALCSLQGTALAKPSLEEQAATKKRIRQKSGFPNCIGCVDGTHIILYQKPAYHGEDYFNRKKQYSLNALLICDDEKKILYAFTGLTGSAHDSRVWNYSDVGMEPGGFFGPTGYVLGDSAYPASQHVLPPYKAPASNNPENTEFNFYHSKARIWIEHTNGILKGRFQSLRGIRIVIKTVKDHARVVHWFMACCVLHNLLQERKEYYEDEWLVLDNDLEEEAAGIMQELGNVGVQQREVVKQMVLEDRRS